MFLRRARGLIDFLGATLCLWAAAYHTPPGALLRTVFARATHTHSSARPLLAYYSGGLYETQPESAVQQLNAAQAQLLLTLAPGPALGRGVFVTFHALPPAERAAREAPARRYPIAP